MVVGEEVDKEGGQPKMDVDSARVRLGEQRLCSTISRRIDREEPWPHLRHVC